jgi:transglutaminase-like putative cysteine protease
VSIRAGALTSGLASRRGLPVAVAALIGVVAVVLATVWTIAPGPTWFGIPTATTAHAIAADIRHARSVMGSNRTPVPDVPGVIIIVSLSAGLVCVAARALWELSRRIARWPRLFALLPAFGMFCYSAPLSARIDRPETAIFFLLTCLAFLVASDSSGLTLRPSGGSAQIRSVLGTYMPMLASTLTALLVLILAAGALSGTVPVAFPWWDHPGSAPPGTIGTKGGGHVAGVSAVAMVANLRAAETTSSTVKMFLATSGVPTYWELGILNRFDGTQWLPGADEEDALKGDASGPIPPTPELPSADNTFISSIDIQGYSGRLLPAPPGTIAITSAPRSTSIESVRIADGLGVVVPSLDSSGESYEVVSPDDSLPALTSGPASLNDIYADLGSSANQYLGLPGGLPGDLKLIAQTIVASAKTPLQQAQLLVDYFHNGTFVYTLSPPAVPAGQNPITWFLNSRAGYCQQFAGAFGVLARELGLPVRLSIGFTTGVPVSKQDPHQYEVTGADAHVWPEVYLGSELGWVSFEPTPSPPNGEPNGGGIVNARALPGPGGHSSPTTLPKTTTKIHIPLPHTSTGAQTASKAHHVKPHSPLPAGAIVGGILAALVAIGAFVFWRRSKRYVRPVLGLGGRNSTDPDEIVMRSWLRATSALGRAGFQRSQWVTPVAHAASVRSAIQDGTGATQKRGESTAALGVATYGYTELAEMAELACYCPGRCTGRDARHAEQEAWRIERALRNSGMFGWFPSPPQRRLA